MATTNARTRDTTTSSSRARSRDNQPARANTGRSRSGQSSDVRSVDARHRATGPAGQGPNTVQGGNANPAPAQTKSAAELGAMTIGEFDTFTREQADWSMSISDQATQESLRNALSWFQQESHRVTALDAFTVSSYLSAGVAKQAELDAYSRAWTQTGDTVALSTAATTLADAIDQGQDIKTLEGAIPGTTLKAIFHSETDDPFSDLRTRNGNQVSDFARYVQTCDPLLHAHDGWEIESYIRLAATADPASFNDIRDVRNVHRFEDPALQQLRTNQAGNSGNLPMTLVLHSAFDHNAAFHHDPEMTGVITEPTNHTVMIEGAETLQAISGRLPQIVRDHGKEEDNPANPGEKVKRIDQIMIAGHGSAQSIELAGSLATDQAGQPILGDNGLQVQDDSLNVHSDPSDPAAQQRAARSRAFMTELMGYMSADPNTAHGRVIFNACLTASNEIDGDAIDFNATPAVQQQQMQQALTTNPSLVSTMRQIATNAGRGNVSVRGGNGSFGVVGLMDNTGGLDIVADGADLDGDGNPDRTLDPELTNEDKFVYIAQGTDPGGCMSAVAECWSKDTTRTLDAVRNRRANPKNNTWSEAVTQALYKIVETTHANNGGAIARLANISSGLAHLDHASGCKVWMIWNLSHDWAALHTELSTHSAFSSQDFTRLVFYQAWMYHDHARIADFLSVLGTMNCRTARPFVYMPEIQNSFLGSVNAMMPASGPANPGQLRLALMDAVENGAGLHARSKSYLSGLVQNGAFTVDVDGPLAGLSREFDILDSIGLNPHTQNTNTTSAPTSFTPDANVDMDTDGTNESHVRPLSRTGVVVDANNLYVRAQPSLAGAKVGQFLKRNDRVYVMGETDQWYLLDHGGTRGYSHKRYIRLL